MTQSREQFEARYPVPEGVQWSPESSRYALVEISTARNTGSTIARYEAYVHSWSVWKASREDVVVALPEIITCVAPDEIVTRACRNNAINECRTAIESAGLRVSP